MPLFGSGFQPQKQLKPNLKMASTRIGMIVNKKTNSANVRKNQIIGLLKAGKYDKANITIESVFREDRTIEAYEIVSLMCELVVERLSLIVSDKVCPPDLVSCIHTILWAAPRLEVPELKVVTKQFAAKYGKAFILGARNNTDNLVNEKIMNRLNIAPPTRAQREAYVKELCKLGKIEYTEDMLAGSVLSNVYTGDNQVGSAPGAIPELPSFPNYNPGGPGGPGGPSGGTAAAAPAGYPGGAPAAPLNRFRVGDPHTNTAGPWMSGPGPAGGPGGPGGPVISGPMARGPAPGSTVPAFPMPATNLADAGRRSFTSAMGPPAGYPSDGRGAGPAGYPSDGRGAGPAGYPSHGRGAGPAGSPSAGPDPSRAPEYSPPPPAFSAPAGGGRRHAPAPAPAVAPARPSAPSAVPDFDELSARFAALRNSQ